MTDIEKELVDRRKGRDRVHGQGQAMMTDVDTRAQNTAEDEGKKYYRRKGLGNIDQFDFPEMYKSGFDPITREDDTSLIPNVYAKPESRIIFGRDMADGKKVDNLKSEPTAWGSPARAVVGGALDAAKGTVDLARDVQDAVGLYIPDEMKTISELFQEYEPEWLSDSAGWGEDMARGMAQFAGGYAGVSKWLGGIGLKSILGKDILSSIASGQTFDPGEGTLGTLANDFGFLPEWAQFLDSQQTAEQEGQMMGRLSMAFEETGIGIGVSGVSKVMSGLKTKYKSYGNELMKQGVMKYGRATSAISHPVRGIGADEVIDEKEAAQAVEMIASGFQMSGGNNADYMEMVKQSGVDESLAKKAWNKASKEKLGRLATFAASSGPQTPMNRQKGMIDLGVEGVLKEDQIYNTDELRSFFQKRLNRGQIQASEYNETIKPLLKEMKETGIGQVTGGQLIDMAEGRRSTFKTILHEGGKTTHDMYSIDPTYGYVGGEIYPQAVPSNVPAIANNKIAPNSYKEHLFIARNAETESGPEGFTNTAHYSEPFIKGTARTSELVSQFTEGVPWEHTVRTDQSALDIDELLDFPTESADFSEKVANWALSEGHSIDIPELSAPPVNEMTVGLSEERVRHLIAVVGGNYSEKEKRKAVNSYIKTGKVEKELVNINPGTKSVFIHEMQSDQASAYSKYGEWSDNDVDESTEFLIKQTFEDEYEDDAIIEFGNKLGIKGAPEDNSLLMGISQTLGNMIAGDLPKAEARANIAQVLRTQLATPSVFNQDKAWMRKAIEPVLQEAIESGSNRIILNSEMAVNLMWVGGGAEVNYLQKYPKILKDYFIGMGVPEKDIHMPKEGRRLNKREARGDTAQFNVSETRTRVPSTESFYVDLTPETIAKIVDKQQGSKLPMYSAAGAVPIAVEFGDNNDNK